MATTQFTFNPDLEHGFLVFETLAQDLERMAAATPPERADYDYQTAWMVARERFAKLTEAERDGFLAGVAVFFSLSDAGTPELPFSRTGNDLEFLAQGTGTD